MCKMVHRRLHNRRGSLVKARQTRREPGLVGATQWARSDGWRALGDVDEAHVLGVVSDDARRNRNFSRGHCCTFVAWIGPLTCFALVRCLKRDSLV